VVRRMPSWERLWLRLAAGGALATISCATYCLLFFRPASLTFFTPDVAILCWLFCSTLYPPFGLLAIVAATGHLLGALLIWRDGSKIGAMATIITGVAIAPAGLPGLYAAYQTLRREGKPPQI